MRDKLIEAVAQAIYGCAKARHESMRPWSLLPSSYRIVWLSDARAALAAIEASGYAVVPKEPTREMIKAACDAEGEGIECTVTEFGVYPSRPWPAMLAAAPKVTP